MKVLRELLKIFMAVGVCSTVSKLLASKSSHHSWKHGWLKEAMDNGFYEQPLQLRTAILLPNSRHIFVKLDLQARRSFFSVTSDKNQHNRDIAGGKNPNDFLAFFGVLLVFLYGWEFFIPLSKLILMVRHAIELEISQVERQWQKSRL